MSGGIACDCGSTSRQIIESRKAPNAVRRRCVCASCDARYTTYEQREDADDDTQPLQAPTLTGIYLVGLLCTLLDRRHLLPNGQIIDCLQLARYGVQGRRLRYEQLSQVIGCSDPRNAYNRLMALRRRGLVDVTAGGPGDPGYLIRRVGPA
jgi:hypothetical protein